MLTDFYNHGNEKFLNKKPSRKLRTAKLSYKKFGKSSKTPKNSKEKIELKKKLNNLNVALNRANSELENYIYRASHDLRAPLVSVLGLINVIKITDREAPPEEYLDMMEGTIKKLDYTLREIVFNASISRRIIQPEIIDVEQKTNQAIQYHKMNSGIHQVNSVVFLDQKELFISDTVLFELIIHHLIGNSFRFRNRMAERLALHINVKTNKKEMTMEISDNGQGIKKDQLPEIFNMFDRSSSEVAGLGLGLYTVQEAVRKLKGVLDIKSTEGSGTSVTLTIPCLELKKMNPWELRK